ncbi:unnamed protein product, partial [Urochloa humidicola]
PSLFPRRSSATALRFSPPSPSRVRSATGLHHPLLSAPYPSLRSVVGPHATLLSSHVGLAPASTVVEEKRSRGAGPCEARRRRPRRCLGPQWGGSHKRAREDGACGGALQPLLRSAATDLTSMHRGAEAPGDQPCRCGAGWALQALALHLNALSDSPRQSAAWRLFPTWCVADLVAVTHMLVKWTTEANHHRATSMVLDTSMAK